MTIVSGLRGLTQLGEASSRSACPVGAVKWWLRLGSSQRLPHTCVCRFLSAVLGNYPWDCPLEGMYQAPPGTLDVLTLDIWNQEQVGCVRGEVGEGGQVWMKL